MKMEFQSARGIFVGPYRVAFDALNLRPQTNGFTDSLKDIFSLQVLFSQYRSLLALRGIFLLCFHNLCLLMHVQRILTHVRAENVRFQQNSNLFSFCW